MLQINPEVHLIRDTEHVRFLRRELREPTLFMFWDRAAGHWSLAYWFWPSRGLAEVLMPGERFGQLGSVYDDGPQLTAESVQRLKLAHRAPDFQRQRQRLVESQRAVWRRYMDSNEELQDQRDYLKRKNAQPVYWT